MKSKFFTLGIMFSVLFSSVALAKTPVYEQMNQIRKDDRSSLVLRGDVEDIYVRVKANKTSAYPGEAIVLQYDLMTRFDASFEKFETETDLKDFGVFTFPAEKFQSEVRRSIFFVDKHYALITFRKQVLFAQETGEKEIKPGTVLVSYRVGPTLRKLTIMKTDESIPLTILPFSEQGKPVDFTGLAGKFKVKNSLDTSELAGAGTALLRFVISGTGDLHAATLPIFEFPENLTAVSTQEEYGADFTDAGLEVRKEVTVLLKPAEVGSYVIPASEISYYDTSARKYKSVTTKPLSLEVESLPVITSNITPLPLSALEEKNQKVEALEQQRFDWQQVEPKPATTPLVKAPKPLKLEAKRETLPNLILEVQTKLRIENPQTPSNTSVSPKVSEIAQNSSAVR